MNTRRNVYSIGFNAITAQPNQSIIVTTTIDGNKNEGMSNQ